MKSPFAKFFYTLLCVSLMISFVGVQPAYAAALTVTSNADTVANDGFCTLREAITNANNNNQSGSTDCAAGAGADTITFAAGYTITLVGSQLPAITSPITINGNGAANTIIQANAAPNTATYRVFEVNTGNLTLDSLTVRHGRCAGACTSIANVGGGIFNLAGTLTVTNSTLSGNSATNGPGGGIFNAGTLNLTNSTLSGNSALFGGGIFNNGGTLTVTDSTLSSNSATINGGGIFNNGGTLTVSNSTLSGNSATNGGGIYNTGGNLNLTNSTLSGNSATDGGGILNSGGAGTITNSTFSGNTAVNGGGIHNDGNLNLTNSTFSGNSATTSGGGIYHFNVNGTLTYFNTIIANSTSGGDCFSSGSFGTTASLVEDGSCFPALSGDPNLGPLQDNGGPTFTHALLSGSIAIDAGNAGVCPSTDQRGVTRPIDGDATPGAICDIGAYEYSPDSTFPTVVFNSLVASYASGAGPSNFTVNFSENVYDPAGNTNSDDVTNPDNYLVVEDGANGTFNTVSCAAGVAGDDVQATITSVTYNAGLYTATVNFSGAVPDGSYRLFVCGTTSIADLVLNTLNNGVSDYTFDFIVGGAVTPTTPTVSASALPLTGFAPHKVTSLPAQPAEFSYTALGDIWLEIPSQNIKSNIVGIPQSEDKTWNVSWLGNDTGWLNGTAFPTWNGNSVLTAHVTDANGLPGPFANLKGLHQGDQIIVHLFDQQYIFEIQNSRMVRPYTTNFAFQSLQDHSYLTLITCQGYNPLNESYLFRRIIRAVLVSVK